MKIFYNPSENHRCRSNNPALLMIFARNNPVSPQWGRPSAQLRQWDWRLLGGPAPGSVSWHNLGFTKTPIVHLEGGINPGTVDRFALPAGIWIISARIQVFIWSLGRGMLISPVSDTEEALFAERKPLCRQLGLSSWLYTEGKHQRGVDEVRHGKNRQKRWWRYWDF